MKTVRERLHGVLPLDGEVVVVGSANADLTVRVNNMPRPGETIHGGPLNLLPGGKSANQAVAASLLGAPTAFVGAVGEDDNGRFLLDSLRAAGVDTSVVRRASSPTSCAVIMVEASGENMIVVTEGANGEVDLAVLEAARNLVERAQSVGLALEIPMQTVVACAQMAAAAGAVTVLNPSPMPDRIPTELLVATDVLIVNEGEMRALVGDFGDDWLAAEQRLAELGVGRSIVTLGPRGSMVLDGGATLVETVDVEVQDTTGCGDAFMGAVLAALAAGNDLVSAASFASVVSSYAAAGHGAQASYGALSQIEESLGDLL